MAPPVSTTSVMFMAASIEIMDTSDMPTAVLKAGRNAICLARMKVSSAMEVSMPLKMANDMMAQTGHGIPVI